MTGRRSPVGGRTVELAYHGRAHTDHDLTVAVPDAGVLFAGDVIEEGNAPWFGDGYPEAWPATLDALLTDRPESMIVPGHGAVVDRAFVTAQRAVIGSLAAGIGRVAAGELDEAALVALVDLPAPTVREALARALTRAGGGGGRDRPTTGPDRPPGALEGRSVGLAAALPEPERGPVDLLLAVAVLWPSTRSRIAPGVATLGDREGDRERVLVLELHGRRCGAPGRAARSPGERPP